MSGVNDTVIAVREKLRELERLRKKKRNGDDIVDGNEEAERYKAWKAREMARIKEDRFNTAFANVFRYHMESLMHYWKARNRDDDAEAAALSLQLEKKLKLPEGGPAMVVFGPSTIEKK